MPEIVLNRNERLALRAAAHALEPVVLAGASGLTPALLKEIDRALNDHELIKVKVPGDDPEERQAFFVEIADRLNCARGQKIGKTLIFWRHNPDKDEVEEVTSEKKPARRKKAPGEKKPTARRKIRAGAKDRVTKKANFSR